MTLFFGIYFLLYFLKSSAGQDFWVKTRRVYETVIFRLHHKVIIRIIIITIKNTIRIIKSKYYSLIYSSCFVSYLEFSKMSLLFGMFYFILFEVVGWSWFLSLWKGYNFIVLVRFRPGKSCFGLQSPKSYKLYELLTTGKYWSAFSF